MSQQPELIPKHVETITYATVCATPDGRVTPEHAALYIGYKLGTLANLRSRGEGPRVTRLGRRVFYKLSDLDEWIARGGIA